MAESPLITFKAGRCDFSGRKVTPVQTPGYVYLYSEDDLTHFCWRPRSSPSTEPDLDLVMIPGDGTFQPLIKESAQTSTNDGDEDLHSPTTGRLFVLKFSSSSQKYYFWMQSKSQHREGSLSWFSQRDQRLGQIVDLLLQGEDVNVQEEMEEIRQQQVGGDGDDTGPSGDADAMDVDGLDRQGTGGAGGGATGGGANHEGEASRDGGADGGRAPQNTNALVQNFLNSLGGGSSNSQQPQQSGAADKPYTTLPDLLTPQTTLPFLATATPAQLSHLCTLLPAELFLLSQESSLDSSSADPDPTPAAGAAAIEALGPEQKRGIIARVLRSPQLQQSLASLTVALRDGGLPMIGEALGLKVENGGVVKKGGSMPLGGNRAVEAFVEGVKRTVDEEDQEEKGKQ